MGSFTSWTSFGGRDRTLGIARRVSGFGGGTHASTNFRRLFRRAAIMRRISFRPRTRDNSNIVSPTRLRSFRSRFIRIPHSISSSTLSFLLLVRNVLLRSMSQYYTNLMKELEKEEEGKEVIWMLNPFQMTIPPLFNSRSMLQHRTWPHYQQRHPRTLAMSGLFSLSNMLCYNQMDFCCMLLMLALNLGPVH